MPEESPVYDPKRAAEAFEYLKPRLLDVPEKNLGSLLIDLQAVAPVVLAVAELCAKKEVNDRFKLLPKQVFDIDHLEELADLAWAGWYVRSEHISAEATSTGAQVPAELIASAMERKARMLKVLDYFLGDDDEVGPELASIRSGKGYLDLASDKTRLAGLYEKHTKDIKKDKKHFRETDEADARADAAAIIRHLGTTTASAEKWMNFQLRVWHLLRASYDEVSATGRYLFRNEALASRFPSLFTATRKPRRRAPAPMSDGDVVDNGGSTPPA